MASPGEQDTRDENIQGKEVPRRRQECGNDDAEWLERRVPDREAEQVREAEGQSPAGRCKDFGFYCHQGSWAGWLLLC